MDVPISILIWVIIAVAVLGGITMFALINTGESDKFVNAQQKFQQLCTPGVVNCNDLDPSQFFGNNPELENVCDELKKTDEQCIKECCRLVE